MEDYVKDKRLIYADQVCTKENSCYSMEYAINGSVALAWLDLEGMDEYPQQGRLVLHFGESYLNVEAKIGLHEVDWK